MSRQPEHSRSRAILIGTSASQDDGIPPSLGAAASVTAMKALLTNPDLCGWPASSVTVPGDTNDVARLRLTLRRLAREATAVLLVYFAGHAIFSDDHERLYLSLAGTKSEDPEDTSLPYGKVRQEVLDSRARLKIVILDCPYSGRVIEALPGNPLPGETGIYGTYVLTSADYAAAPGDQAAATPFTAQLISTIRTGIPGGRACLTLDDLYVPLVSSLRQHGLPEPNRQVSGGAEQFAFTRNAAYDPRQACGDEPASPYPVRRYPSRRQLLVAGGAAAIMSAAAVVAVDNLPDRAEKSPHQPTTVAWRGRPVTGPADRVYGLAFSPDGSRLAGGSADGNAWLWEVRRPGARARRLRQGSTVYGVAFSRDGRSLATGSADGTVQLWDLDTGRARTIARHSSTVWQVAFSNDGRTLASSSSDRTVILSPVGGHVKPVILRHPRTVFSVTFDPAGKTLATGCNDAAVRLWDLDTHRPLATLNGHRGAITQIAFQPHRYQTLATGSWDHTVRLWDLAARRSFATLTGFTETVNGVAFSPDGRNLATGSADATIDIWNMATLRQASTRHDPVDVFGVAFSPDGSLLATTSHQIVWLWDV